MRKVLIFSLIALSFLFLVPLYLMYTDLPSVEKLKDWKPPEATLIYDYKGRVFGDVALQRRYYVSLKDIPPYVRKAFISAEDRSFYRHFGVDLTAILRAFLANIKEREVSQGASTITQQLARNLFLTPERSLKRKIKEALLAIKIERAFSKDKILEMYLNYIYLGQGAYGVEAASRIYFGKHVKDLNLDEAALLAALPKAPTKYNPFRNPERIEERRNYVLKRMYEDGYISEDEYKRYSSMPVKVKRENRYYGMDYFLDYVKDYLIERYGEAILAGGYKVYTTIDRDIQRYAQEAVRRGVMKVAKANGIPFLPDDPYEVQKKYEEQVIDLKPLKVYIGRVLDVRGDELLVTLKDYEFLVPRNRLSVEKGDYVIVKLIRKKGENLKAEVIPDLEGALVSLDAKTGAIRALVGGYSYLRSPYNRAVYAERQPGSAIKPIIYLAALMKGYTQASTVDSTPKSFYDPSKGKEWTPKNYEGEEYGTVTLRTAIAKSINTATVNLLSEMGFDMPIEIGRLLGIDLKPYYSMALGSIEVTPLELTSAYQAFADLGVKCKPYFVEKVLSLDGKVIEENTPKCEQVLPPQEVRVLVDMLRAVVLEGTGASASSLGRIVAGKTGTTNDYMDTWFVGFSPNIVTGVWVGFDTKRSMGKGMTGARVALPIWMDFMSTAAYMFPNEDFPLPEGTIIVSCPTPMVFVDGTQGVCSGQEGSSESELKGIVDPNLLKKLQEELKVKEIP
ncbi:MAG: penicillin-binding protein 1A [Aquificaceae bacterium]